MYAVNNQKASTKTYLINDLKSNLTNVRHEQAELSVTASLVQTLAQGSYLRADEQMSQFCTKASSNFERALSLLEEAIAQARELETREELPD